MYLKMPRSIGRFSLNIFGDLWGESLSLCWYECRIDILAYMHLEIKGIVMGSGRNLLGIIGDYWEFIGRIMSIFVGM